MEITMTMKTNNDYYDNEIIMALHYALQCAEEKLLNSDTPLYYEIIKEIRSNEPIVECE